LIVFMPALFVFLWATGYVVAKLGMPYAGPLSFLAVRFGLTCVVLGVIVLLWRVAFPKGAALRHLIISGLLLHAGYLSGVWCAIKLGMPAGVSALIVNLQPLLTAFWVAWVARGASCDSQAALAPRVTKRQWIGLALGFAGVGLVVYSKMGLAGISWQTLALSVFALLSITAGTLYQKAKVPQFDLRTGTLVQYLASFAVVLPAALLLESEAFNWTPQLVFAFAWSVFALSIGAIFLMFKLIERGEATQVASLFYLVPVVTALIAWLLFDERLANLAWVGVLLTCLGVWMVQSQIQSQIQTQSK
jgi:drug/metabolite transporter (DMT)-like permease